MIVNELFLHLHSFCDNLYLVGGSVRDLLLNRQVSDYDFATPFVPSEIKARLAKCGITKYFEVGEKYGTIGCLIEGEKIEITTFRGEQYNYVNRKPEVSYISSIYEDVKRRDLTINAMYLSRVDAKHLLDTNRSEFTFNPSNKHLALCLEDLRLGVIQTVGNPGKRFKEDPLRMLRAVRFASQLNFSVEKKTMAMIQRLRVELLKVSAERWSQEMDKILSCEVVDFDTLKESCLLSIIIPELSYQIRFDQNSQYHNYQLWEHTGKVVNAVPHTKMDLRWSALLHDIGKPFVQTVNNKGNTNYMGHEKMSAALVAQIGSRLHWAKERIQFIQSTVETHQESYNILREYDQIGKVKHEKR
jgi:tRNA nucleotidyltransferase (CCA-adding enzyme)